MFYIQRAICFPVKALPSHIQLVNPSSFLPVTFLLFKDLEMTSKNICCVISVKNKVKLTAPPLLFFFFEDEYNIWQWFLMVTVTSTMLESFLWSYWNWTTGNLFAFRNTSRLCEVYCSHEQKEEQRLSRVEWFLVKIPQFWNLAGGA